MRVPEIASIEDVRRIERAPYDAFMPFTSVFDGLSRAAAAFPERRAMTAIVSADDAAPPRAWTYREFLADVRRAANLFHALADGEEPRVAMLLPAIPEAHLTVWAAETAGVVCPINFMLSAEHVAELVEASGANLLVALGPHPELDIWSRVPGLRERCPGLKQVLAVGGAPGALDFEHALRAQPADALAFDRRATLDSVAALFHTGGTTGAPKLARHLHRNQLHAACGAAAMYASSERDVMLNGFPLFHVAGSFVYGLSTLLTGGELLLPTLLGLRDPRFMKRYWAFVERHGVTLLAAVPTVMAAILNVDAGAAGERAVRMLLTGGSPLPTELATAFEKRFGIPVRNILGMTECGGVIAIEPFRGPRTPGSCGLPLPFTQVVATGDDGRDRAPGETGILRLRGPNVGPGYTDARRDAGTFAADGWLVTGDVGHVDAHGRVFVTGRAKDVIIRGGHNIDPGAIEEALLRHPEVEMAAAVGAPDEYAGELPVAFVALRPGATVSAAALTAFVERHIPERAAVPKRIEALPALPLTAVGKVYKPALRVLAVQRVIDERLVAAGLADRVTAVAHEAPGGPRLRFACRGDGDGSCARAVGALMGGFAVSFEIEPAAESLA